MHIYTYALCRLGSLESKGVFEEVTGIEPIVNAAAGHWHSLAVSKKGNVYAWGKCVCVCVCVCACVRVCVRV